MQIAIRTNDIVKWHPINSKQKIDALNIGVNTLLLLMLNIEMPEGALSYIIYRVSLIWNHRLIQESFWLKWFIMKCGSIILR